MKGSVVEEKGKEDIMKIRKGLGEKKERIERKSDDSEDEAEKYWKIVKIYASGGVKEMLEYFGQWIDEKENGMKILIVRILMQR